MFNRCKLGLVVLILIGISHVNAQLLSAKNNFTHADTLRGTYGPGRDWWDALKYDIHATFNLADSSISGYNTIQFKVIKKGEIMQIDLQEPMTLDSISYRQKIENGETIIKDFKKEGNAYFIPSANFKPQTLNNLTVYYHGKPTIAKNPPWDGGLIMKKDKNNNPFVSIACQGMGASVWYPCKDHQSDEPDSAEMHITIPDSLVCVGNGRFRGETDNHNGTATYDWAVVNPINNYNIIPYIGKYVHFGEVYKGAMGNLDMDYWVLEYNLEKAKTQFKDAPRMMEAFEYWFGPYPFYKDGYKLVESPHLGMEHQSATAYGNKFINGYLGRDLSGSGWGLKWDFIIVHESGHEWFANNITTKDLADMWVHEGFTSYSETLFTEYFYGKKAGEDYLVGLRKNIINKEPVIGFYNVNNEGSGDMYYKGSNMLHTIRHIINNDSLFRKILRGLNKTFYHQTVTSAQVEQYISINSKINFSKVFDQYLRSVNVPILEYKVDGYAVSYRFTNCIKGFTMPVMVVLDSTGKNEKWISPTENWQTLHLADWYDKTTFKPDRNFYIKTKNVD